MWKIINKNINKQVPVLIQPTMCLQSNWVKKKKHIKSEILSEFTLSLKERIVTPFEAYAE